MSWSKAVFEEEKVFIESFLISLLSTSALWF